MIEEESSDRVKQAAMELLVLVAPFILLGVVLTASVFGAIFGIPLLICSWLVWRTGRLAHRSPDDEAAVRRLKITAVLFSSILTVVLIGVVAVGADDLDTAVDAGGLLVAAVWVAMAWHAAVTARRVEIGP